MVSQSGVTVCHPSSEFKRMQANREQVMSISTQRPENTGGAPRAIGAFLRTRTRYEAALQDRSRGAWLFDRDWDHVIKPSHSEEAPYRTHYSRYGRPDHG